MTKPFIHHGSYYVRITKSKNGRQILDKWINLSTMDRQECFERKILVKQYENDIKNGIPVKFPWQNEERIIKLDKKTISECINNWIKYLEKSDKRKNTIDLYSTAVKHLTNLIGDKFIIERISNNQIELFISHFKNIHSNTTINMNLRAIRTFLLWLKNEGVISNIPKIPQLRIDDDKPKYVSDIELDLIKHNSSTIYSEVFEFYKNTGLRLSEPFDAELNGRFLTTKAESSKTHQSRDVELSIENIERYLLLLDYYNNKTCKSETFIKRISKEFKKACRKSGIENKNFHCLRHTFAL